jgi:Aspartyl/Asparaginyl beta-hydroxylase
MALGPGARSPFHSDTKCGLPWDTVRLHVPIVTTPGAVLQISSDSADPADVETICWQPGELWYADFTRPHLVRNTDEVTRIHLVIDAQVTEPLLDLLFVSSTRLVPAAIAPHDERLALFLDGEPSLALVHLGNGEFRFAGWTEERSLKVTVAGPGTTEITLRSRIGDSVLERELTGQPL